MADDLVLSVSGAWPEAPLLAGMISYLMAGLLWLGLSGLVAASAGYSWKRRWLAISSFVTAIWSFAFAFHAYQLSLSAISLLSMEIFRFWGWLIFLSLIVFDRKERASKQIMLLIGGLPALFMVASLVAHLTGRLLSATGEASNIIFVAPLILAIVGLILTEQVFRNSAGNLRYSNKFLCFALGGIFAFDIFIYSNGLLYKTLNIDFWSARGIIVALAVPLVAISAKRNKDLSFDFFVSRHAAFYSASLLGVAVYFLVVALGGYYIKHIGGSWAGFVQTIFVAGSILFLLLILTSSKVRAELRVFLVKHFYRNKYEYREEWLRLIRTLDSSGAEGEIADRAIMALVQIVGGPSGILWLQSGPGRYEAVAVHEQRLPGPEFGVDADTKMIEYLRDKDWIIDVEQVRKNASRYPLLDLPEWMSQGAANHLVIPIKHGQELVGFALVETPVRHFELTFEDIDLLRTVGRQIASYFYLESAMQKLAESRQFDAFNRLTSFLMHDLKNIVGQQSLVVQNAVRHKSDPRFVDDAISTIEISVERMKRLLAQLESKTKPRNITCPDLAEIVRSAVKSQSARDPVATLDVEAEPLNVLVDEHQCLAVVEHLIRNAQDATPAEGRINVRLYASDGMAVVEVNDTGMGMDEEFVKKKLFEPFFSTKGAQGMGIGAYQVREFASDVGGRVEVRSCIGEGTSFLLSMPQHRRNK